LENLEKSRKLRLAIGRRDSKDIDELVAFFEGFGKRYGKLNANVAEYGCLYFTTQSKEHSRVFFDDFFSGKIPVSPKIKDIDYVESTIRIPEETCESVSDNDSTASVQSLIDSVVECKSKLDLSDAQQTDKNLINVAVIDTGVDYLHSKLKGKFDLNNLGRNFVLDFRAGVAPLPENAPLDQRGHGTHIAGIIVKEEPSIRIYSLKVLDHTAKGDPDYLVDAVKWCKLNNIDIINLSLWGLKYYSDCEEAILDLPKRVILCAAAGNGQFGVSYPAHYPRVISIGSVDRQLQHSCFSNIWHSVDVSANGERVASTYLFESYAVLSGTSMATANVSAVIASGLNLLRKRGKSWNGEDIEKILKKSITEPPKSDFETILRRYGLSSIQEAKDWAFGAGIVDKDRFLKRLKQEYGIQ
jgi:hypothetical protein